MIVGFGSCTPRVSSKDIADLNFAYSAVFNFHVDNLRWPSNLLEITNVPIRNDIVYGVVNMGSRDAKPFLYLRSNESSLLVRVWGGFYLLKQADLQAFLESLATGNVPDPYFKA